MGIVKSDPGSRPVVRSAAILKLMFLPEMSESLKYYPDSNKNPIHPQTPAYKEKRNSDTRT
jgi:hypothetical protein